MTRFPDRFAAGGLALLAALLWAAPPAAADEGVARVSDRVAQTSHAGGCVDGSACCPTEGGPAGGCCSEGGCTGNGGGCLCNKGFVGRGATCGCCKNGSCGNGGCGKAGCGCGKGGPLGLGLCGKSCGCGCKGCRCGSGDPCRDWDGDGDIDDDDCRCRDGHLHDCRGGLCFPCLGLPIPCLPLPCLPGLCGPMGPLGGTYGRVYALNPSYHDFRDGAVYAAQGYAAPISVPLAPNVNYTMNYGWGVPSSRLTPVSRFVPSPYANVPMNAAVPNGYAPAAGQYLDPRALDAQNATKQATGDLPPWANAPTPAQ